MTGSLAVSAMRSLNSPPLADTVSTAAGGWEQSTLTNRPLRNFEAWGADDVVAAGCADADARAAASCSRTSKGEGWAANLDAGGAAPGIPYF